MNTITAAEFATEVNSDARTVRKFLRSQVAKDSQPGKGKQWALPAAKRELNKLTKQFHTWAEANAKPVVEDTDTRTDDQADADEALVEAAVEDS